MVLFKNADRLTDAEELGQSTTSASTSIKIEGQAANYKPSGCSKDELTYLHRLQKSPDGVPVAVDALLEVLLALVLKKTESS